jgi:hypothetical protein
MTTLSKNRHCAEIYLYDPGVAIPITKNIYKTKSDQLMLLLRSSSISRDNLEELKNTFIKQSYEIKVAYTTKKNLIKRLSMPISIDDPMLPIIGINILEKLALQLNSKWPGAVSVGYAIGDEKSDLPGKLKYGDIFAQVGYKIGLAAGRAKKLIIN